MIFDVVSGANPAREPAGLGVTATPNREEGPAVDSVVCRLRVATVPREIPVTRSEEVQVSRRLERPHLSGAEVVSLPWTARRD